MIGKLFGRHEKSVVRVLLIGMLLHFILLLGYQNQMNHDVAQYITMARSVMNGAVPFRDIMDTNPPIIIYLSIIPNLVSDLTDLDIVRSAHFSMLMFMLLVYVVLRRSVLILMNGEDTGLDLVFAATVMYVGTLQLFRNEFAQREHLIALLLLPYAVQRAATIVGREIPVKWEIAAGLLAIVALYLKPVYILIPLLTEAYVFLSRRHSVQWSAFRLPMVMLVSGLLLLFWPPMRVYVFEWPLWLSIYYLSDGFVLKKVLTTYFLDLQYHFVFIVVVAVLGLRSLAKNTGFPVLVITILLYTVGSFLAMLAQGKGWYYHKIPQQHGIYLLAGMLLFQAYRLRYGYSAVDRRATFVCIAVFLTLQIISYPSIINNLRSGLPRKPENELSQIINEYTTIDESVASISAGVGGHFPAITYSGRKYASRYYSAFPVILAYSGQKQAVPRPDRKWIDDRFYSEFCADIERNRPKLLTVETMTDVWNLPDGLSMLTYLEGKGFFTTVGCRYRYLTDVGETVSVFLRIDKAGSIP